ncbi:MAG: DUF6352 family protein [Pseudomonadota bacterium]
MTVEQVTAPDFWLTSGFHLLKENEDGSLGLSEDYLRAYLKRAELAPVEESCANERALHASLLDDPFQTVDASRISSLADADMQHNFGVFLGFRDFVQGAGSLEAAYLAIARGQAPLAVPPLFVDQIVHAVLRNVLRDVGDPLRLRAAELFFRDQNVSTEDGIVMLADDETVEMFAETGGFGSLGQLIKEANTPLRQVQLDVLHEDNSALYWPRSDRFDTVIDFRFLQPANDAFCRVLEDWMAHFLDLDVSVQPKPRIDDERWIWHIGLDAEATRILNALYEGQEVPETELEQIIGLFEMRVNDKGALNAEVEGRPIYLGLAKTKTGKLKMKPQNLLTNLPLAAEA